MDIIDERYKNGKIYKIVCNETNEVYYGSTIIKLKYRINRHRNSNMCMSRQIINRNNYYYELIEDYSCNNKYELETRERWYIENNNCINKIIPTRTDKEYYENNKEKIKVREKIYREQNKEKLQQYREKNKEKTAEYDKKYRQNNKEKLKVRDKLYYENNKDRLKETLTCSICGSIVRKDGIKRHQRGKKCLDKNKI